MTAPLRSDNELILLYKDGNAAGMEHLLLRHKDRVFTSIYMLVKDKYLAEDIFQDVFVKVIDTLRQGKYKEEGKFLPWVLRIAHNLCVDHFRKVKRTPTIKTGDDRDIFEVLNFSEPSIEDRLITGEKHEAILKMLDRLPQDQRETIILRHHADLSFKDISVVMNCSINTCLGRMRYALINLRKMMAEYQIVL